jgi:putative ABC transport system substrate-binding protein
MHSDLLKRREFITLLGGAAVTWPFAAHGQQAQRMRRIGVLIHLAENDLEGQARLGAFRDGLGKLGWQVGGNLSIDYRWKASNDDQARAAVAELLKLAPDVILANSSVTLRATQQLAGAVPIVFTTVIEPVAQGFVTSLAHPGGLTTGFAYLESSIGGKWLDLLKDIAPGVTRVVFMFNPQRGPYSVGISRFVQEAAQRRAVQYVAAPVFESAEVETVMAALAREPGGGMIVSPDSFTVTNIGLIIDLAARHRLPAIYSERNFAADGGLMSYGADYIDMYRQAATYVDRILRGDKPADLPVQQPSKFFLVINLKTAKALGLTVSDGMQLLADEVIE